MSESAQSVQEFVSLISHDLRAPIRHLSQFSILLGESIESLTEEQQEYLTYIRKSADKCNLMMAALSQLSRLQADANPVAVDFDELAEVFIAKYTKMYGCTVDFVIKTSPAKPFLMDAAHGEILLASLLDNAFKFRRADTALRLRLEIASTVDNLQISLTDNGIGIPEKFVAHCRTIFKQYDSTVAGVGAGLTFADAIVSRYGGVLDIQNTPEGAGTRVTMDFPLATGTCIPFKNPSSPRRRGTTGVSGFPRSRE